MKEFYYEREYYDDCKINDVMYVSHKYSIRNSNSYSRIAIKHGQTNYDGIPYYILIVNISNGKKKFSRLTFNLG